LIFFGLECRVFGRPQRKTTLVPLQPKRVQVPSPPNQHTPHPPTPPSSQKPTPQQHQPPHHLPPPPPPPPHPPPPHPPHPPPHTPPPPGFFLPLFCDLRPLVTLSFVVSTLTIDILPPSGCPPRVERKGTFLSLVGRSSVALLITNPPHTFFPLPIYVRTSS